MTRSLEFRAWDGKNMNHSYSYSGPAIKNGSLAEFFQHNFFNTIMQYTGLKDRNGTKIFEGDIVRNTDQDELDTIISWIQDACCFGRICGGTETWFLYQFQAEEYEVVGNIYENPELPEN